MSDAINQPRPVALDIGDAAPKQSASNKVLKDLITDLGWRIVDRLYDRVGVFGYVLKDPDGFRYYLIVKGSDIFNGVVSSQSLIPNRAASDAVPLLLAHVTEDKIVYYVFFPMEIINKKLGFNERLGVIFVNWEIALGAVCTPRTAYETYKRLRRAHSKELRTSLDVWLENI